MPKPLQSLSIFFPFYNDAGTVALALDLAYTIGRQVTHDLEVIAIHGGTSKDETGDYLLQAKKKYPDLVIIDRPENKEGYAVIKYGFLHATKQWVFYTDGDLQYDVNELRLLVTAQQTTRSDVVNGYKVQRDDSIIRRILGKMYELLIHRVFDLPIHDVDCDFRLIKRACLEELHLISTNASILPELIYKLAQTGATFTEVPVSHYSRRYGRSNYNWWSLTREKIVGDFHLFFHLRNLTSKIG